MSNNLDSYNNPDSSTLRQRLHQRLFETPGVINTQQLHCHYQTTQGMAKRLIQRVALPEQVKFRYGSGVLQPTAMLHNLQRQRRESANDFEGQYGAYPWSGYAIAPQRQLPAASVFGTTVQPSRQNQSRQFKTSGESKKSNLDRLSGSSLNPLPSAITQKATAITKPWVEQKPTSDISSSFGQRSGEIEESASRGEIPQRLRVNRQAAMAEVNALSSQKPHSRPGQVNIQTNVHLQPVQTQLETGRASSPSLEKAETWRISRQARISAPNTNNSSTKEGGKSITHPNLVPGIMPKTDKHQDLPLIKAINRASANTVQTKVDTSVDANSLGTEMGFTNQPKTNSLVIQGIMPTQVAAAKFSSTVSTKLMGGKTSHCQSLPLALQRKQTNLPVQRSPAAAIAIKPTVVSPQPSQLLHSSELSQVWLKSIGELNEERAIPPTYSQKMPLPLAKTPIRINRAIAKQSPEGQIARQTNVVDRSTVQLAMSGNSLTQMLSPETASGSPIDLTQVAEQVSRMLARQLTVEKERRGIERW